MWLAIPTLLSISGVFGPTHDGLLFDCTILRQALYAGESLPPPPPSASAAAAAGPAVPDGAESIADGSREAGFRKLGAAALAEDLASFSFRAWGEPRACFFFGEGPSRYGGRFLAWSHIVWVDRECDGGGSAGFVQLGRPRQAPSRCSVPPARTACFGVVVGQVPPSQVSCCHTHHSCYASSDNIWAVLLTYVRQRCKQTFPRSTRPIQLRNVSHSL